MVIYLEHFGSGLRIVSRIEIKIRSRKRIIARCERVDESSSENILGCMLFTLLLPSPFIITFIGYNIIYCNMIRVIMIISYYHSENGNSLRIQSTLKGNFERHLARLQ